MIGLLMRLGAPPGLARAIAYVLIPLALIFALWLALDAYGDRRYDEGHADADSEWREASDRLIEKAQRAETKADEKAAERAADFAARQEDEKEAIHAALEEGSSPLDALFPGE